MFGLLGLDELFVLLLLLDLVNLLVKRSVLLDLLGVSAPLNSFANFPSWILILIFYLLSCKTFLVYLGGIDLRDCSFFLIDVYLFCRFGFNELALNDKVLLELIYSIWISNDNFFYY